MDSMRQCRERGRQGLGNDPSEPYGEQRADSPSAADIASLPPAVATDAMLKGHLARMPPIEAGPKALGGPRFCSGILA